VKWVIRQTSVARILAAHHGIKEFVEPVNTIKHRGVIINANLVRLSFEIFIISRVQNFEVKLYSSHKLCLVSRKEICD
jgi:hypothetical protein